MVNRNKKILLFFCLFFLIGNFCLVMAKDVIFTPQIEIPGEQMGEGEHERYIKPGEKIKITGTSFIEYMIAIYKWSVGAIAIIAVVMIMIAGFQWMAATGNASAISQAKSRISSSLIGLLLAVGAYSLLNFINPSLVYLRGLEIGNIDYVKLNISEETCSSDGYVIYEWDNYKCFSMLNDSFSTQFFRLSDFGIIDDIENVTFYDITFDSGIDSGYVSNCDAINGFKAIAYGRNNIVLDINNPITFLGQTNNMFAWYHNIMNAGDLTWSALRDDLYGTIDDASAAILLFVEFDTNDSLTGINVELANKSPGKASALIKNIKIRSNKSCISCCKGELWEGFFYYVWQEGVLCDKERGLEIANPSQCCDTTYSNYAGSCGSLTSTQCKGVEQFCGTPNCYWSQTLNRCESSQN